MTPVSGRSGAFETGGPVACVSLIRGPRIQHHSPLTRWRTSWQDGPIREGVSRALGTRPGAGISWGARSSDVPTALGCCDAGASPEPVRCAPLVVDACGYDRDGSAAVSYTHLTLPTNREV